MTTKAKKTLTPGLLATKGTAAPPAATVGAAQRSATVEAEAPEAVIPFNFKVPPAFAAAFRRYAFETGRKQSSLLQDAFDALMAREDSPVNHAEVNEWVRRRGATPKTGGRG